MENTNNQKPKKGTLWMILVPVIVVGLLLAGISAYFVINSMNKPTPAVSVSDEEDEDEDVHFSVRMSGYVDQYPVRMRLEVKGTIVSGDYYYESQGPEKKLLLNGTWRNGHADLNETTVEGQPTGHFRGELSRRSFEGEFINGQGNSMYFNLSR